VVARHALQGCRTHVPTCKGGGDRTGLLGGPRRTRFEVAQVHGRRVLAPVQVVQPAAAHPASYAEAGRLGGRALPGGCRWGRAARAWACKVVGECSAGSTRAGHLRRTCSAPATAAWARPARRRQPRAPRAAAASPHRGRHAQSDARRRPRGPRAPPPRPAALAPHPTSPGRQHTMHAHAHAHARSQLLYTSASHLCPATPADACGAPLGGRARGVPLQPAAHAAARPLRHGPRPPATPHSAPAPRPDARAATAAAPPPPLRPPQHCLGATPAPPTARPHNAQHSTHTGAPATPLLPASVGRPATQPRGPCACTCAFTQPHVTNHLDRQLLARAGLGHRGAVGSARGGGERGLGRGGPQLQARDLLSQRHGPVPGDGREGAQASTARAGPALRP
jgi:hypothetical protein